MNIQSVEGVHRNGFASIDPSVLSTNRLAYMASVKRLVPETG